MWDYNKLFAEGNIVGFKHSNEDQIQPYIIYEENDCIDYFNDFLYYRTKDFISEIQYIIRLDEHGNVAEKLFDRERDIPNPMPELKTGMFIKVKDYDEIKIGLVYAEENHVIYQEGGYDFIYEDKFKGNEIVGDIVEVYSKDACAFDYCDEDVLIWRDSDYQNYLDSKSK